jgi:hypothetical protein
MLALQGSQLLAKGEIFKQQPLTRSKEGKDRTQHEPEDAYHGSLLSERACG